MNAVGRTVTDRQAAPAQHLFGQPVLLVLRARRGLADAHLRDRHLRHVDERLDAVVLRDRSDVGGRLEVVAATDMLK